MGKKLVLTALVFGTAAACAACSGPKAMGPDAARKHVEQLMVLYKEARTKFVIQKQEIIQADSCDRGTALKDAVVKMEEEANMSPQPSEDITKLRMELVEAEKLCLEK